MLTQLMEHDRTQCFGFPKRGELRSGRGLPSAASWGDDRVQRALDPVVLERVSKDTAAAAASEASPRSAEPATVIVASANSTAAKSTAAKSAPALVAVESG